MAIATDLFIFAKGATFQLCFTTGGLSPALKIVCTHSSELHP
jgi:hypothetical protein